MNNEWAEFFASSSIAGPSYGSREVSENTIMAKLDWNDLRREIGRLIPIPGLYGTRKCEVSEQSALRIQ